MGMAASLVDFEQVDLVAREARAGKDLGRCGKRLLEHDHRVARRVEGINYDLRPSIVLLKMG